LLKFIFKAFEIHPEDQRGLNKDEKLKDLFSWCSDSDMKRTVVGFCRDVFVRVVLCVR